MRPQKTMKSVSFKTLSTGGDKGYSMQELVEKAKKLGIEIPESLSNRADFPRTSAQREH